MSRLRSICWNISWVLSQTRPNTAFESCRIANHGKNPDTEYLKQANKTLRKVKNKNVEIVIRNVCDMKKVEIVCYKDASHTSLSCRSSKWA